MIQPVSAVSPQAEFRGSKNASGKKQSGAISNANSAFLNASGVAVAAGGLTTAVTRAYTSSWAHAGVLGMFAAFLTMFFMMPHLIEKAGLNKVVQNGENESELVAKTAKTAQIVETAGEHLKPAKKLVQFRQQV